MPDTRNALKARSKQLAFSGLLYIRHRLKIGVVRAPAVGGNPNRATAVTILTFLFLVALPILLFVWVAYNQATVLLAAPLTESGITVDVLTDGVDAFLEAVSEQGDDSFNRDDILNSLQEAIATFTSWLADVFVGLAGWFNFSRPLSLCWSL